MKEPDRRVTLLQGFDALPDSSLISVQEWAALQGVARSTVWARIKNDPQHPRPVRLSAGCTRLRVGECRAYIATKQAATV